MEHALILETTFLIDLERELSAADATQLRRIVTDMYGEPPR